MQWIGLMMMCCGMAVKGMGILEVREREREREREMKALTVKMDTVALFGKGRQILVRFVY
jgi:hypothetical protein